MVGAWLALLLTAPGSRPLPGLIRLYLTPGYRQSIHIGSLESSARRLGKRLEVWDDAGNPVLGFDEERQQLNLRVRLLEGPIRGDARLLGWSHEEPLIEVSLPRAREIARRGLHAYWDCRAPLPGEVFDEALARVLSFTLKHETFVHQLGQLMPTRRKPYRMDLYSPGFVDSAALEDVFWDGPWDLRPDHPYLIDRKRL